MSKIYLVPSVLDDMATQTIPAYIIESVKDCQVIFAENERTARRFLKSICKEIVIDNYEWFTIHKAEEEQKNNFRQKIKEEKNIAISNELQLASENWGNEAKTVTWFASNKEVLGIFAIADKVKSSSAAAIKTLQQMNIEVYMLTGDNRQTAAAVAGNRSAAAGPSSGTAAAGKAPARAWRRGSPGCRRGTRRNRPRRRP